MTGRLPLASSTRSTGAKRCQGIQKPKDCGRSRRTSPQKRDRSGSTWSQYGPVPAEAESHDDAGAGGHCDPCTPDRAEEPPPPLTFVERMRAGRDAKRDARHAKSAHLHCSSGGSVLDQLAKVESDPKVHSERPVTNRYVKETTHTLSAKFAAESHEAPSATESVSGTPRHVESTDAAVAPNERNSASSDSEPAACRIQIVFRSFIAKRKLRFSSVDEFLSRSRFFACVAYTVARGGC